MTHEVSRGRSAGLGTALVVGAGLSTVNGFVVAAIRGAVGVVGREQSLLLYWLAATAVLLPVYTAVVLVVLRMTARRTTGRGTLARTALGIAAVALAGTVAGTVHLGAQAGWDVRIQNAQLTSTAWTHFHAAGTAPVLYGGSARCDLLCVVKRQTLDAHLRSIAVAAPVVLGLDLLVVTWSVLALGGDLLPTTRRRREVPVQPTGTPLPVPAGGTG